MKNCVDDVRPGSTFEAFQCQNSDHLKIKEGMERLTMAVRKQLHEFGYFENSRIINLYGKTGRGKTHLVEAFINGLVEDKSIITNADSRPQIYLVKNFQTQDASLKNEDRSVTRQQICLLRGKLTPIEWSHPNIASFQIVVVDDLFSHYTSIDDVQNWELDKIAEALSIAYEKRQLVLTTSNFPTAEVFDKICQRDQVIGRIRSRLTEMSKASIELTGNDYREIIAQKRAEKDDDPFGL